ncbi:hypothetical protein HMPREF9489_0090 [Finegoldia magna SY403409CC001050417]|nr:hypothetical protein HMPREF9489_0090 [Finegoldia magna SY403409CC001050417]
MIITNKYLKNIEIKLYNFKFGVICIEKNASNMSIIYFIEFHPFSFLS